MRYTIVFILIYIIKCTSGAYELNCPDVGTFKLDPIELVPKRHVRPPKCDFSISFLFFTRSSKEPHHIASHTASIEGLPFNGTKPTVFFFHGWQNFGNEYFVISTREEYLKCVDVNYFVVNYTEVAIMPFLEAASSIRVVGRLVALFIKNLVENHNTSPSNIHVIGISLGAHTAAYAAKEVKNVLNSPVNRLTGLDPSGPFFDYENLPELRFDKSDATFVEAIHTSKLRGGSILEVADVDFVVNDGKLQPGCPEDHFLTVKYSVKAFIYFIAFIIDGARLLNSECENIIDCIKEMMNDFNNFLLEFTRTMTFDEVVDMACSHMRIAHLYPFYLCNKDCDLWGKMVEDRSPFENIESIDHMIDLDVKDCNSTNCLPMSLDTIKYNKTGTFFVPTNAKKPFCIK